MLNEEVTQNGSLKDSTNGMAELEEFDFSTLPDKPRNLNIERQSSFDERSLTSPIPPLGSDFFHRFSDHFDGLLSPKRSGYTTPRSPLGEPHPMVAEAWENLRQSLVHFRGQPVGTIAALDSSDEKLNYDQVTDYTLSTSKKMLSLPNYNSWITVCEHYNLS